MHEGRPRRPVAHDQNPAGREVKARAARLLSTTSRRPRGEARQVWRSAGRPGRSHRPRVRTGLPRPGLRFCIRVVEEVASLAEEGVEPGHLVAGLLKDGRHDGADVAAPRASLCGFCALLTAASRGLRPPKGRASDFDFERVSAGRRTPARRHARRSYSRLRSSSRSRRFQSRPDAGSARHRGRSLRTGEQWALAEACRPDADSRAGTSAANRSPHSCRPR